MNIYKAILKLYFSTFSRLNDWLIDRLSIRAYNGLHPKNIFNYRAQFFLDKIKKDESVLDIACGSGALIKLLSKNARQLLGIDIHIENKKIDNYEFLSADIFSVDYKALQAKYSFDVVILSHILEHIEYPVEFLKKIEVKKLLICVPSEENWKTTLKKNLNVFYKSDNSHFREYTREKLQSELTSAGFQINAIGFNSEGEITCEAVRR